MNYIPTSVKNGILWSYGWASRWIRPIMNNVTNHNFNIDEVCTGVYISDFASACNVKELKEKGITHIVTAILGVGKMYENEFTYFNVDVRDAGDVDISEYFDQCADFIENAVTSGKKVLIHCMCGVSRSTTLTAAYLIKKKNHTAEGAIELIKKCRDCVCPNPHFVNQLQKYEHDLRTKKEKKE